MDGPQCLLGSSPEALRASPGHAADRRSRIRGIPMAGSGGVRGAVLEAAGGGGAPAEGRRHWWWRFRAGAAAACGESGVHGTAASGAAEPAGGSAVAGGFPAGGGDAAAGVHRSAAARRQGRYLTGLRSNPPAQGAWFVPGGRIRKNEPLALALDRIAREELGLHAMAAAWTPCGVHEHFYSTNFAGEINRSTHYIVLAYEAERALDPPACRTRSIAATAGCRPPPSSPTLTCIPTPGPTSRSTRHDQSPPPTAPSSSAADRARGCGRCRASCCPSSSSV